MEDDDVEKEGNHDVEEEDGSQDLGPNAQQHVTRATWHGHLAGKMLLARTATHTLCEPARSKCTSTCHKGHFIRKFTGNMPFPRTAAQTSREPAHQHVTGGTSYGN